MKGEPITAVDSSIDVPERRLVYGGEVHEPLAPNVPRGNRPVKRRRRSPFNLIAIIFLFSLLIVLYVWNKIAVNQLAVEVNDLQTQYQRVVSGNEALRAEISRKSALERIGKIASEQLGMTYPKDQPVWFDFNSPSVPEHKSQ